MMTLYIYTGSLVMNAQMGERDETTICVREKQIFIIVYAPFYLYLPLLLKVTIFFEELVHSCVIFYCHMHSIERGSVSIPAHICYQQ